MTSDERNMSKVIEVTPELLREIVQCVLADHPPECLFVDDAVNVIVGSIDCLRITDASDLHSQLCLAIENAEIYCPHEGIDRRS